MKKIVISLICIAMIFSLSACSEKEVSEKQIFSDVENLEVFSNLNVEISDFDIIKRQTSPEDKTDYVYVNVKAANEDISIERNYMLTYILYNDGWLFENIESFDNPDSPNVTVPLHGVPLAQVNLDMDGLDLEAYRSNPQMESFRNLVSVSHFVTASSSFAEDEYLPIEDDGNCYFQTDVQFYFDTFYEDVSIPVTYIFGGGDFSPDGYKWRCEVNQAGIEREIKLHDGILGYWSGSGNWGPNGYLNITSYTETTCEASFYVAKLMDSAFDVILELDPLYDDEDAEFFAVGLDITYTELGEDDYMPYISIGLDSKEPGAINVCRNYISYWSKG